ncbi:hypothetical protein Tiera_010 [Polaromonas phage Tiera]|nr:hypothetical protein Tiera_010 [Polaromonas phage Tiera]
MKFTEVVNEVMNVIKRPDQILNARRLVNASVNFCCQDSDFKRDRVEISLDIDPSFYGGNLPYTQLERFRKFWYVKPKGANCFMTPVGVKQLRGRALGPNEYYEAGNGINYNLNQLNNGVDIGYFQFPPKLTDVDGEDSFWLLDSAPYMIIDRVLGTLYNNIGDERSAAKYNDDFRVAYLSWRADHLAENTI